MHVAMETFGQFLGKESKGNKLTLCVRFSISTRCTKLFSFHCIHSLNIMVDTQFTTASQMYLPSGIFFGLVTVMFCDLSVKS